eukprot:s175_g26.t1
MNPHGCGFSATPPLQIFGILLPPARMRLADLEADEQQLLHDASLLCVATGLAASFCVALGGLFADSFCKLLRNRTSIESRYAGPNPYDVGMLCNLTRLIDVTIFRQRLFSEDGSAIPDDEILASAPVKIMIVILEYFQTDAELTQRMMSASIHNDMIELESLLRKPLNPNVRDENGTMPLHWAAKRGHVESLKLLIEAGTEKDVRDQGPERMTPLHWAAQEGHLNVVRHLVEVGADKDQRTVNGATPLFIAAQEGHLNVVRHLVEVGAHKDQARIGGATPLFIAAGKGHLDVVRHVVEVGAHKDQARIDGATPLFIAAGKGHLDVVRHLVEVGACTNEASRKNGVTALHAAANRGHVEIVRFLIERGADSRATTRCGRTAMDLASQGGHSELVERPMANGTSELCVVNRHAASVPWRQRMSVKAPVGSTLVDVAKEHGVDIHAACGQKLQCATCHVILEKPYFERLQSPGLREEDLLDSTFTLTDTSRLGCQVRLTKDLDGIQCTLPDSNAKGNVRMTVEMPRPKVQMQLPGTPAVAPSVKRGAAAQPNVEELLELQQALSARLEAHLREVRAKAARKADVTNASDNSGQSAEEEKEDLSKLKAELRATRVEVKQLGRKARFEDVIGLDRAKEAIREAILWPAMANPGLFSGVRSGPKGLLLYGARARARPFRGAMDQWIKMDQR